MNLPSQSLVVVTGPTASGKSAVGLRLAKDLGGEIINADSVQIYKDFDIGSAKPSAAELAQIPHHLFSLVSPEEEMNAAVYSELARTTSEKIWQQGRVPIVVGGTGLYLKALLHGLSPLSGDEVEAKKQLVRFEAEMVENGADEEEVRQALFHWLKTEDPERAAMLHPRDVARVRRALVVKLSTGESLFTHNARHQHRELFARTLVVLVIPSREELYRNINRRVDEMLQCGLVAEVKELLQTYSPGAKAFSSLGYRQVCEFLRGELDEAGLSEAIKRDTRRFAKRQLTWWRNQVKELDWIRFKLRDSETPAALPVKQIQEFLHGIRQPAEKTVSYAILGDESEMASRKKV